MSKKAVLILAGGKGSRIGGKKYKALLNGLPLLVHVYKKVAHLKLPIYISVRTKDQEREILSLFEKRQVTSEKRNFIYDGTEGIEGPLAGIVSAMKQLPEHQLLVVATDQPLLETSFLRWLLKIAEQDRNKVFICKKEEKMEPFPGVYPSSLANTLTNFLKISSKKSLYRFFLFLREAGLICFLQNCDTIAVKSFFNVNTPEDLKLAEKYLTGFKNQSQKTRPLKGL